MFTAFKKKQPFLAYKAPALAFAVAIFVMSSIPGHTFPNQPFWSSDKVAHLIEFGLFGILVYRAFRFPTPVWRPYPATVIIGTFYAAFDELHQFFVPGRNCDIGDFAVDVAGVVLFAGFTALIYRKKESDGTGSG